MRVNEIAKKLDVSSDTVRYYVRIGLIKPRKNSENGSHQFSVKDASKLRFILTSRSLGFSISDIRKIFIESDKGNTPCPTVKNLIQVRLQETEKKYLEIAALRKKMINAMKEWESKPNATPCGDSICHLIEGLISKEELM